MTNGEYCSSLYIQRYRAGVTFFIYRENKKEPQEKKIDEVYLNCAVSELFLEL
jgi:hypothetical protein